MQINGSSGSGSGDYSRITGLATGMDTDSMVKAAVAADKLRIDTAMQNKQILEWQQEAYVDVIKDLKEFYNSYLDILGPSDTNMMLSSTYAGIKAASGDENILKASTLPGAIKGIYQVKVDQLAEGAKKQGDINTLISSKINLTDGTLWNNKSITFEVKDAAGVVKDNVSITVDGVPASTTLEQIASIMNDKLSQTSLKDKLSVGVQDGAFTFNLTGTGTDVVEFKNTTYSSFNSLKGKFLTDSTSSKLSSLGIAAGDEFKITTGGKIFEIKVTSASMTVNDFINSLKNVKSNDAVEGSRVFLSSLVDISVSELTKKLTFQTKQTGASASLKIEEVSGNASEKLGLMTTGTEIGKNSIIQIKAPGESSYVSLEKESNNISIDGLTLNLINKTETNTPVAINVNPDGSSSVDKFKKFVEKYNSLIDKLNKKITEKKNMNYKPLTEDQRKEMKEDEIKTWDEQAKKGLLSRESNISNVLVSLRQSIYSAVSGTGISISDIGIGTTNNYLEGGKLVIDETKLKNALETKGDLVQKLFTQTGTTAEQKGILQKMKETLNTYIGSEGVLIKKAGYENSRWAVDNLLSKNIKEKNTAIKEMEKRMYDKQERYYKMFAALERNMNSLNSQSNWLYSQLGTA
jgi:flagellar hook-associated protein 2